MSQERLGPVWGWRVSRGALNLNTSQRIGRDNPGSFEALGGRFEIKDGSLILLTAEKRAAIAEIALEEGVKRHRLVTGEKQLSWPERKGWLFWWYGLWLKIKRWGK